jgi:hypothetical protein
MIFVLKYFTASERPLLLPLSGMLEGRVIISYMSEVSDRRLVTTSSWPFVRPRRAHLPTAAQPASPPDLCLEVTTAYSGTVNIRLLFIAEVKAVLSSHPQVLAQPNNISTTKPNY